MSAEIKASDSRSWEKTLFKITFWVLVALFVGSFVPILGLIIMMPFFCTGLLWCYSGAALVCVTFPLVLAIRMHRAHRLIDSVVSATRWSVILFGALGAVLMLSVFAIPGYKSFTLGYWVHAKIWLRPAQVRDWAAHQKAATDSESAVPWVLWPSSLKLASLGSGRLRIDPETGSILLVDGGGFGIGASGSLVQTPLTAPSEEIMRSRSDLEHGFGMKFNSNLHHTSVEATAGSLAGIVLLRIHVLTVRAAPQLSGWAQWPGYRTGQRL